MLLYLIHEKNGEHESRQQIAVHLIVVEISDSKNINMWVARERKSWNHQSQKN